MIRLRLFGGAVIDQDGAARGAGGIASRRHPVALMALLACSPSRTLSRAKLAGLLWPERPEAAARNRLNSCVYNVRRALGDEALITVGENLRLGDVVHCDAIELRDASRRGDHQRVADLFRGPLLDGFYLSRTPEFERWLDLQRDTHRQIHRASVEDLALAAMAAGRPGDAARHWQALSREEPYDSHLVIRLVEALDASGNPGAARRVGEGYLQLMAQEFGREPHADLVQLLDRIHRGTSRPPSDAPVQPGAAANPPPNKDATPPPEAQLRYVQGRGHLDERTEGGLRLAAEHFQAAIDLWEGFAAAWAGLADALDMLRFYDYAPPENAPTPLAAARRALAIDPECGEGWAALGIAHSIRQEGPEAAAALERAIEIRPAHAEAYAWLAWVHLLMGRPEQALAVGTKATEIDPLAPAYRAYLAEVWLANGQTERARIDARRAVEIQPGYGLARFILALVEYHRGDLAAARAALDGTAAAVPSGGTPRHAEIRTLEAFCEPEELRESAVRACLAQLEAAPGPARDPASIGLLRAALGDLDGAFDAFGRVQVWRDFANEHVRYFYPDVLAPLRADPRYEGLVASVNGAWGVE